MGQFPARGANEGEKKVNLAGKNKQEKEETCLLSFAGVRQFVSKSLQARVDFWSEVAWGSPKCGDVCECPGPLRNLLSLHSIHEEACCRAARSTELLPGPEG